MKLSCFLQNRKMYQAEHLLNELYYNIDKYPDALTSIIKLQKMVDATRRLSPQLVREYLHAQPTYTKHRPAVKHAIRRNKMLSRGIGTTFQADLADVQKMARQNHGWRYLLCVIDIFSRRAWVEPIKKKTGANVRDAFQRIWESQEMAPRQPTTDGARITLATDAGKEFLNAPMRRWMEGHGIDHFVLQGQ